jgi:threonine dehydratase
MPPSLTAIRDARERLRRHLPVTRLVPAPSLSARTGQDVHLKLESELPTGSFKPRGALYALAVALERREVGEVIASSTGNHGAAVAYAARLLGRPATIFLPEHPNPVKRARIAALGARIEEHGKDIAGAAEAAAAYARRDGVYYLDDATDPDLPAGPATIACEILEQLADTDTIYVPMGDTALIRGIGAATRGLAPAVKLVGVQAEGAPAYARSWREGRVVTTEACDTVADGLATRAPDEENVRAIRELVADVRLVSDDQMLDAIRHLLLEEHVVAEPAGAAATAALLASDRPSGRRVVLLVTGANIAPSVLRRAVCERD